MDNPSEALARAAGEAMAEACEEIFGDPIGTSTVRPDGGLAADVFRALRDQEVAPRVGPVPSDAVLAVAHGWYASDTSDASAPDVGTTPDASGVRVCPDCQCPGGGHREMCFGFERNDPAMPRPIPADRPTPVMTDASDVVRDAPTLPVPEPNAACWIVERRIWFAAWDDYTARGGSDPDEFVAEVWHALRMNHGTELDMRTAVAGALDNIR